MYLIFYTVTAQWCGHCKRLQPEWEEAALKLHQQGAILGWVDATVETELAAIYQVQSYPTIKIFPGSGVGGGDQTNATFSPPLSNKQPSDAMDYALGGDRTTADVLVQYLLGEVDRTGIPTPLPQLMNYEMLHDSCGGRNQICVLGVLPHLLDSGAAGRNRYRDVLRNVASKSFRGSSFRFLWVEGTSQPALEETLEYVIGQF
jgi:protein disulfide-isomerase A6